MPTRDHLRESWPKVTGDLVDPPNWFQTYPRWISFCRFSLCKSRQKVTKERTRARPVFVDKKRDRPRRDSLRCAKIKEEKQGKKPRAARQGEKRKGKSVDGERAHAWARVCGRRLFRDECERSILPKRL